MKTNKRKIISKSLYVLAGILLVLSIWTFFTQVATVAQMFKAGELKWSTKALDIFTFFATNSIVLLIRAVLVAYIGYEVSHGYAAKAQTSHSNESIASNDNVQNEVVVEEKVPNPLTLQDGIIKTFIKEQFVRLSADYSEVFFDSDEKIQVLEAFDSADGDSEVIVFEATDTWDTLEAAKNNLEDYYEIELSSADQAIETDKLIISSEATYGNAKGFYVVEIGIDTEAYLFLDIDDSVFVVRYITNKKKDDVIQRINKMKVNYK